MIQVRGIAAELSAAAERELAQRTEACDRRLLVRHAISRSIVDGIAFAGLEPPGELVRLRVPCRCTPGWHGARSAGGWLGDPTCVLSRRRTMASSPQADAPQPVNRGPASRRRTIHAAA